jgi:hypothetical protein
MTQQYTRHDFSPINPPSVKPSELGWYVIDPDWVLLQRKATSPHLLNRFSFAYWNGSKWTSSCVDIGLLFWFGLKDKA